MKRFYSFVFFVFLFGCASSEKSAYDSLTKKQSDFLEKENNSSREIAYLKNLSKFEEGNFQFVIKQMKEVVKNYSKMKKQLIKIEAKLDNLLNNQSLLGKNSQKDSGIAEGGRLSLEEEQEEEVLAPEEASSFQEEMTDDTIIFPEEEREEGKYLQNQEKVLTKITENDGEKHITIPDKNRGSVKVPLKTVDDHTSLIQDILSGKFAINDNTKKALLQTLRSRVEVLKESNEEQYSSLVEAKKLFKEESYESAISQFQKYRDNNPEGSHYPEATFYIGQSFKNLKMPIEAEVFFKEIVESYPQSLWASRAKKILEE